jgi:hypothetical protein
MGVAFGFVTACVLILLAFGLPLTGGATLASRNDDPNVFHTCIHNSTGQARLVPEGQALNCLPN